MKTILQRVLIGGWALSFFLGTPVAQARREALFDITHGQLPSDTGSDQTFFNIEDCQGLGGPALKVSCPAGDSFGDRSAKVTNWKSFTQVEFSVFNPSFEPITLGFNIKHPRSISYATRLDVPLRIIPGRNDLKILISSLTNVDGSAADLEKIVRWYLANTTGKTITLYIGDINLTGDAAPQSTSTKAELLTTSALPTAPPAPPAAGEEVCFDYAMTDGCAYDEFECVCGAQAPYRPVLFCRVHSRPANSRSAAAKMSSSSRDTASGSGSTGGRAKISATFSRALE